MPYCPKCGNEVTEEMEYCSKCGASLKAEKIPEEAYEKYEKHEKHEKREKEEKAEKHEKRETSRFWVLIGGLILVVVGATSLITTLFELPESWRGAFFLVAIGLVIIILAIRGATRASRTNPRP
ncbi:MAG: zinc ribbon domain-containing protein [Candidatus Bathyarchaeota archaeon]|nr:zinc ribbon domain-containing protein [Candidatus Bathyarchaeota archaeon]MDH5494459.1 zinc ribbon domain-containing protein [Candidatus Bathyarchaeota archaeon]